MWNEMGTVIGTKFSTRLPVGESTRTNLLWLRHFYFLIYGYVLLTGRDSVFLSFDARRNWIFGFLILACFIFVQLLNTFFVWLFLERRQ